MSPIIAIKTRKKISGTKTVRILGPLIWFPFSSNQLGEGALKALIKKKIIAMTKKIFFMLKNTFFNKQK